MFTPVRILDHLSVKTIDFCVLLSHYSHATQSQTTIAPREKKPRKVSQSQKFKSRFVKEQTTRRAAPAQLGECLRKASHRSRALAGIAVARNSSL
ncbi:hypothetical protein RRG08_028281 [Elysia crispata]|uniref:Uncharacterized protein n=1 Tax=Elysia crispata TaxID=231223 RepID=A0AAE1AWP6_9GAST|nr:hypothetical protein RRG08_028281 [Elysia crispata]